MATLTSLAQDKELDPMHKYLYCNGESRWGLWGQISGSFSPAGDKYLGWIGARIGTVYNDWLNFGIAGYALYNENITSQDRLNRTYRMEGASTGIFIEPRFDITRRISLGASLYMGHGQLQYRYEKEYREEMLWTEEIIDRVTFAVFEPGINGEYHFTLRWSISAGATYKITSPLRLWNTGNKALEGFSTHVSLKFGLF